jgi:hypothetical protein
MNIYKLMLNSKDKQDKNYKEGWNDAVCYLNDNYCISNRNGDEVKINLNINLDEDKIIKAIGERNNE